MIEKLILMNHEGLQQSPTIGTQQFQGTGLWISPIGGLLILMVLIVAVVITHNIYKKRRNKK